MVSSYHPRLRITVVLTIGLLIVAVGLTGCDLIEPFLGSGVDLDLDQPPLVKAVEGEMTVRTADGTWSPLTDSLVVEDSVDIRLEAGSTYELNWDGRTFMTVHRAAAPTGKTGVGRDAAPARRDSTTDCPMQVASVEGVVEVKLPGSDEWIVPKVGQTLPRDTEIGVGYESVLHLNNPCTEREDNKFLVIEGLTEGTPKLKQAIERKKFDEIYDSKVRTHIHVEDVTASFRVSTPRIIAASKG